MKVECFGKSQRTEKTDLACTNYVYDEHFYFEKTNLSVEQLDSAKIIIEAYDAENAKNGKLIYQKFVLGDQNPM